MTNQPAFGSVPPPQCPAHAMGGASRTPIYDAAFADDPAAAYAAFRRAGPIVPVELAPGVDASMVVTYDTALRVMRDPGTFSKDPRRWRAVAEGRVGPDSPVMPMMEYRPSSLFTDGEEHRRRRTVVEDSLSRIDPVGLRGYVEETADTLIDMFQDAGEADLLADYAAALPLLVLTRLLGAPAEYGERLVTAMTAIFAAGGDAKSAHGDALQCLQELVTLKRGAPGSDLVSWMIDHPLAMADEELVHELSVMFGAGTQPEQNLIANALRLLLSDDRFAGSLSGGSLLIEDALDEVLWKDPPLANFCVHFPLRDVALEGTLLRKGDPVIISMAAASNDPGQESDHRVGNRAHLAWGAGPHVCPAKGSSQLIATVAIERLLDRIPDVELAVPVDRLRWRPGPFQRALAALPVLFPPTKDAEEEFLWPTRTARTVAPSPVASSVVAGHHPEDSAPGVAQAVSGAPLVMQAWRSLVTRWRRRR